MSKEHNYSEIRNKRDYINAYKMLRFFLENDTIRKIKELSDDSRKWWEDDIADMKRKMRSYTKQNRNEATSYGYKYRWHIVKDNGIDGYVELVEFPTERYGKPITFISSIDDAKEFFEEHYYIYPYYTDYDCTGKPFTEWYYVFKRNGKFYAYHSVGYDV